MYAKAARGSGGATKATGAGFVLAGAVVRDDNGAATGGDDDEDVTEVADAPNEKNGVALGLNENR